MTIVFKDKRAEATEAEANSDEQLQAEQRRLQSRQNIRRELAQIELHERRIHELDAEIGATDAKRDAAADAHQVTTTALQARLKEIEEIILQALTDRQPVQPETDEERADLIRQIAEANEVLQREIEVQKELSKPLRKERADLEKLTTKKQALLNQLARPEYARPDLYAQLKLAGSDVQWASRRVEAAKARIMLTRKHTEADPRNASAYAARRAEHEAELRHAEQLLADAQAASDAALKACRDE